MKLIDANVLIYAALNLNRKLDSKTQQKKAKARNILKKIESGDKVVLSTVHFSEYANIIEAHVSRGECFEAFRAILDSDNIVFFEVDRYDYISALAIAEDYGIDLNDAIAAVVMENLGIENIYSFDDDFNKIPWINRIES